MGQAEFAGESAGEFVVADVGVAIHSESTGEDSAGVGVMNCNYGAVDLQEGGEGGEDW